VSWPDSSGWKLDPDAKRFYAKGVGYVKLRLHRPLPGRPKTATLGRDGRRWWVSISCDRVEPRPLARSGRAVGVDLGVASVVTTSDGEHVANLRHTRASARRLAAAQRDLATKKRGSKRRRRAVERVAAQHRKVANCRRDHAHQLSRRLVDT
jgi:putative transposase